MTAHAVKSEMLVRLTVLTVMVLAVPGLAASAASSDASITGTVTDAETGQPIEGAAVDVNIEGFLALAETDSDGVYRSEGLPSGDAELTVQATGYERFVIDLVIVDSDVHVVDAMLTPVPLAGVAGEVFDSGTTAPVAGASISLLEGASCSEGGPLVHLGESDGSGLFTFEEVAPGPALLSVTASGYKIYEIELDLVAGESANLVLVPLVPASSTEEAVACPTTDTSEEADGGQLPFTGLALQALLTTGVLAAIAGVVLLWKGREA